MKRKYVHKALLLLGATTLTLSARAAGPVEVMVTRTETVKYAPAGAQEPAGAAKLYGALQAAASRVCRDPSPLMLSADYVACADAALAKAVEDVNIAAVSAIHLQSEKFQDRKGVVTVAKR
jgi:UrcA family protein